MTTAPLSSLTAIALLSSLSAAQVPGDASVRVPVEQWGCTNCHAPDASNNHRVGKRPGPDLSNIGDRVSSDWMKRWIGHPAKLRSAPTMPRMFGSSPADQADLEAVVQFLSSQRSEESSASAIATEQALLTTGRTLYHTTGCVNCHGAFDSPATVFEDEFLSNVVPEAFVFSSFSDLDGKWVPAQLSAFLRDPAKVHRDGRMPGMNLTSQESDALTNYLLTKWKPAGSPSSVEPDQVRRGREVLQERDCLSCHTLDGMQREPREISKLSELKLDDASSGCLSSVEWDGPRYDLPAPPMARMFKMSVMAANNAQVADPELDALERQVNRLNCRACHEIDQQGGIAPEFRAYAISLAEDADLGDEGRYPPHLNDVGAKLTTSWFKEVLQSSGAARPYLATRMPQFGDAVHNFPELFAKKAGVEPGSDRTWPEVNDERVLQGRDMAGTDGFSCVTCHSFGEHAPLGTPGTDMQAFAGRLRYEWWDGYIKNPELFKPGTRMPKYTDDEGRAVFTKFCGGDFQAQTDAMWAYFTLGETMPLPKGMKGSRSLLLRVGDRPRILRTYLNSTGSRGIAVGFPVGLHFAYDAASARMVEIWQGKFLDASGAWAGRGGNSTGAQGEVLWKHGAGPTLLLGESPDEWPTDEASKPDYRGYRLEADGTPVFLSKIGDVSIEERIVLHLHPERIIEREFRFRGLPTGQPIVIRPGGRVLSAQLVVPSIAGRPHMQSTKEWFQLTATQSDFTLLLEVAL